MKVSRLTLPAHLRFLLSVHFLLLAVYSLFRYVMLLYNRPSYFYDAERSISIRKAFWIGFQFDITVASYALFLPYLVLTFSYFRPINERILNNFVRIYCGVAILVSLIICAADVPYFRYYNSRLNTATIHLKNMVQIGEFILKEVQYYPFILVLLVGLWGVKRLVKGLWDRAFKPVEAISFGQKTLATLLASIVLVCGLWGGVTPRRPDMKSATFSNDGFINQLTLNPVHTWFDSYFEFDIQIFSLKKAITRVQQAMKGCLPAAPDGIGSPIERPHSFDAPARPMNVVLVIMESMSADRMGIYGNPNNLTPGLDRWARKSVFFDNCYSNGIHTNVGIFSSLYSMPAMMMQHPMINGAAEHTTFTGLPVTLKDQGYKTVFFCSHPKTFDNLDIFLQNNGFDQVSDQSEYQPLEVTNAWGVSDESLMAHALTRIDSLATTSDKNPFFATVLTITTHPPHTLPTWTKFKPHAQDPIEATYEYADWAISSFLDSCATKDWYENTIFVLVGDHGVNLPNYPTDVPLSYNHVPLIIHAPALLNQPEARHEIANQTDIYPTVMGLLRHDYTQNTLGFDLFREKRPFAIFSQDYRMCAINDRYLYVARKSGSESLYDYRTSNPTDLIRQYPELADSMKSFACSNIMVSQWMVQQGKTAKSK